MAQMAGRASVEFYVGLALKARGQKQAVTEEAFVIRAFRNGLGVFVSKSVRRVISLVLHLRVCVTGWESKA